MLTGISSKPGCSQTYETRYTFTPPHSAEGKLCVTTCRKISPACKRNCRLEEQAYLTGERRFVQGRNTDYASKRHATNLLGPKSTSVFENDFHGALSSPSERGRNKDHRIYFQTRGGRVTAETVCTAYCQ
jgi:hypothetical protein